jgi:parallel beta-helix repeat protein
MRHTHLLAISCAIILAATLIFLQPVTAHSAGGTFTVNTANDSNTPGDVELSLREAIQIANGTLTGPFSLTERGQLSGCTFNASGFITNNCGGGNNLIQFTPTLTQVTLNGRLPETTANDLTITGQVNSGRLIVNSTANDLGFWVGSNNVDISHFSIINASDPIAVVSNIAIKGLRIHDNYLGITPDMTSCSGLVRGPGFGVILFDGSGSSAPGDGSAYIYGNTIGCANYDGVAISNLSYVYIGEDALGNPSGNYIGRDQLGHAFPNGSLTAGGISSCCGGIPQHNVIANNTIANSYFYGIDLVKSPNSTLTGNILEHNGTVGIHIEDSANITLTNNIAHDNGSSGLWLSGALTTNNSVSGGQYYRNGAAGITEGEGANTNWWLNVSTYDNAGLGIDKNDNGLPDATGGISITSIDQSNGVVTVNGQYSGLIFLLTNYHIELYRQAPDPSGFGEGRTYLGAYNLQLQFPNDNTWHITDPGGHADCYTAVLTIQDPLTPNNNTSYEFAANYGQCYFAPQTITFNPIPAHLLSDPPFSITATASSGLQVSFGANGVCSVNGNLVTLSGVGGTCSITATQPGDATYAPATPIVQSFNVGPVMQFSISGSGGGSVNSNPTGIACTSGTCQAIFSPGTSVTLSAVPNGDSVMGAWSGACSGCSGGSCTLTIAGTTSCSVDFTFVKPARIGTIYYDTLQAAYDAAADSSAIQAREYSFLGNLTCNFVKNVTINGGYNQTYTLQTGYSIIKGIMTIGNGSVITDRVKVE